MASGWSKSDTIQDRFWPKVDKTDGCWFWTSATTRNIMCRKMRDQNYV